MIEDWASGIFTSTGAGLGAGLAQVRQLGATTVHLHAPHRDQRTPENAQRLAQEVAASGIAITVVFVGFEDDDYTTVERVEESVGLVPQHTREERVRQTLEIADFAHALGVAAIGMHLGALPGSPQAAQFLPIVKATRAVCDHCARNNQSFHLETGQETAAELLSFLQAVDRPNLAVNFDPANMILYGAGDPLEAMGLLGPYIRSVHCKDARYDREPGQPWYEDAPLGQGDVDIEAFLRCLHALGYTGALTIEREYSPDQTGDIEAALNLLRDLRGKILGTGS
jgi:sugar phosphate isomerase/epimerase